MKSLNAIILGASILCFGAGASGNEPKVSVPEWMGKCSSIVDGDSTPTVIMVHLNESADQHDKALGMLERRCFNENKHYTPLVRVLFRHSKGQWIPYDQCYDINGEPAAISEAKKMYSNFAHDWTVVNQGKELGRLQTKDFLPYERLREKGDHPFRGVLFSIAELKIDLADRIDLDEPKNEYKGWNGEPTKMPLVLTNGNPYRDPGKWTSFRPDELPDDIANVVLNYFKKQYTCEIQFLKQDHVTTASVYFSSIDKYTKKDLVITKAYKSNDDAALYGIATHEKPVIVTLMPDVPIEGNIYVMQFKHQEPQFIGKQLELIDIGDYDGDGKTEFMFWSSEYNLDGYVLGWGRPMRLANARWIYH